MYYKLSKLVLQIGVALFYYKLGQTFLQIWAASLLQIKAGELIYHSIQALKWLGK